MKTFHASDAARVHLELDHHTRRALTEASRDLSAAIERAADRMNGASVDQVLSLYDLIANALRAVGRIGGTHALPTSRASVV